MRLNVLNSEVYLLLLENVLSFKEKLTHLLDYQYIPEYVAYVCINHHFFYILD